MWPAYLFITYLILALSIPTAITLWPVWRRARRSRRVTCPSVAQSALVSLDPWYAVRMHTLGNDECRVAGCSRWPESRNCSQDCREQIGTAA